MARGPRATALDDDGQRLIRTGAIAPSQRAELSRSEVDRLDGRREPAIPRVFDGDAAQRLQKQGSAARAIGHDHCALTTGRAGARDCQEAVVPPGHETLLASAAWSAASAVTILLIEAA